MQRGTSTTVASDFSGSAYGLKNMAKIDTISIMQKIIPDTNRLLTLMRFPAIKAHTTHRVETITNPAANEDAPAWRCRSGGIK